MDNAAKMFGGTLPGVSPLKKNCVEFVRFRRNFPKVDLTCSPSCFGDTRPVLAGPWGGRIWPTAAVGGGGAKARVGAEAGSLHSCRRTRHTDLALLCSVIDGRLRRYHR